MNRKCDANVFVWSGFFYEFPDFFVGFLLLLLFFVVVVFMLLLFIYVVIH